MFNRKYFHDWISKLCNIHRLISHSENAFPCYLWSYQYYSQILSRFHIQLMLTAQPPWAFLLLFTLKMRQEVSPYSQMSNQTITVGKDLVGDLLLRRVVLRNVERYMELQQGKGVWGRGFFGLCLVSLFCLHESIVRCGSGGSSKDCRRGRSDRRGVRERQLVGKLIPIVTGMNEAEGYAD